MSEQLVTVVWSGLMSGGFATIGLLVGVWQGRKNLRIQLSHERRRALDALRHSAFAEYLAAADSLIMSVSSAQLAIDVVDRIKTLTLTSERARLLAPADTAETIKDYSTQLVNHGAERMAHFATAETPPVPVGLHPMAAVRTSMVELMRRDLGLAVEPGVT